MRLDSVQLIKICGIRTDPATETESIGQVAGAVALGTTSHFERIISGKTGINLKTGASINGRLLAQTAVTL